MKLIFGLFILIVSLTWAIAAMVPDGGQTMLADGEITTVIQSDGTIKTCTQFGSGPTSVIICN